MCSQTGENLSNQLNHPTDQTDTNNIPKELNRTYECSELLLQPLLHTAYDTNIVSRSEKSPFYVCVQNGLYFYM